MRVFGDLVMNGTPVFLPHIIEVLDLVFRCAGMRVFGDSVMNGTPVFLLRGTGGCADKAALVHPVEYSTHIGEC